MTPTSVVPIIIDFSLYRINLPASEQIVNKLIVSEKNNGLYLTIQFHLHVCIVNLPIKGLGDTLLHHKSDLLAGVHKAYYSEGQIKCISGLNSTCLFLYNIS